MSILGGVTEEGKIYGKSEHVAVYKTGFFLVVSNTSKIARLIFGFFKF